MPRNQLLLPGQQASAAGLGHVRSSHVHADGACQTSMAERPLDSPSRAVLQCLPDWCSSCAADGQADGSAKQGLAGLPGQPNLHRDSIRAGYPEAPQAESSWNDWNDSEGKLRESVSMLIVCAQRGHADAEKSLSPSRMAAIMRLPACTRGSAAGLQQSGAAHEVLMD